MPSLSTASNPLDQSNPLSLPRYLTTFVGRQVELEEIRLLLQNADCRLLTLVGAGGSGKTRLAVQAAVEVQADFADGVCFIPLQSIDTPDLLPAAMADALNVGFAGSGDVQSRLLAFLQDKAMLLVLDNFEQLLDGVDWLIEVLYAAPQVKLLVTSREGLNLQEEWLYAVQGLLLPVKVDAADFAHADAIQLFVERARRMRPDFNLADERAGVMRICRLVEGLPLALELAASWTKSMNCTLIAAEIEQNLGFLETRLRNVPARHRSVRVVFEQSWRQLPVEEQDVFKRLSVFRGGCRRAEAEQVTGASLAALTTLVEKSFLRWEAERRRFYVHELMRQYAAEQLAADLAEVERTNAQHCACYAAFLADHFEAITGHRQIEATDEIEAELENIRVAWRWAVEQAAVDQLWRMVLTLVDFFQLRSRYREGAETLAAAIDRLRSSSLLAADDPLLALLLTYQGGFYIRLGRVAEAEALLLEAQAEYRRLKRPPVYGNNTDPDIILGIIAAIRGDYGLAARRGEQARQTSETHQQPLNQPVAYYLLATAALGQGDYDQAYAYAQTAYKLAQQLGNRWFMAYCLNELGDVAYARADYPAAKGHFEAGYLIKRDFQDAEGMALALTRLSEIAIAQGDYAEAKNLGGQSRALYQQIGDRGGLATAFNMLAQAALGLGEIDSARQLLGQALELALAIDYIACLLAIFYNAGHWLLETGETEPGLNLLALVQHHPATTQTTREQVLRLFDEAKSYLAPDLLAVSRAGSEATDLTAVGRDLFITLTESVQSLRADKPFGSEASPPLVEPLSERELEVLQLLVDGLQNREIAARLTISLNTVKTHIGNIFGKLGVNSRVRAASRARELDLL